MHGKAFIVVQVCGSMPYDDSNIRKMIKNQTERRVHFSRSKNINPQCKELVWSMLEANIGQRYNIAQVINHAWLSDAKRTAELEAASEPRVQTQTFPQALNPIVQEEEGAAAGGHEVSVRS